MKLIYPDSQKHDIVEENKPLLVHSHHPISSRLPMLAASDELTLPHNPSKYMYSSVLVTLLGGLQYGWSVCQLNASAFDNPRVCKDKDSLDGNQCVVFPGHSELMWIISINAWILGGALGSLFSGSPSNHFGRKAILIANSYIGILGSLIQACSLSIFMLTFGRFLSGISSGTAGSVGGIYIGEISPKRMTGSFVSTLNLSIVIGEFLVGASILFLGNRDDWRLLFCLGAVPGILQAILIPTYVTESPRWLIAHGRQKEALEELKKLWGKEEVQRHYDFLIYEHESHAEDSKTSNWINGYISLLNSSNRSKLLAAVGVCIINQLCGISCIFYYSYRIFGAAGASNPEIGSLIVYAVNVIASLGSVALIDLFGRKTLLLTGIVGMGVSLTLLCVGMVLRFSVVPILGACAFVAFFDISLGPLLWLLVGELFPAMLRSYAQSIATFFFWMASLFTGIAYPYLAESLGLYSFTPFLGALVLSFLFVFFAVPETKNILTRTKKSNGAI